MFLTITIFNNRQRPIVYRLTPIDRKVEKVLYNRLFSTFPSFFKGMNMSIETLPSPEVGHKESEFQAAYLAILLNADWMKELSDMPSKFPLILEKALKQVKL